MPKKERKVTCPRCHRSIPEGGLIEHMRSHKWKRGLVSSARVAPVTRRQRIGGVKYACDCGLQSETREEARSHVKRCDRRRVRYRQVCSTCSAESEVLLPYESLLLCPTCAIEFFETKEVYGSPMINHMGKEFEDIFNKKIEALLRQLGVGKLSELGVNVVLITFSQSKEMYTHHFNPRGELIFMFTKMNQMREKEKKVFESIINHETFHAYVTKKLKLGISSKLKGPFSFLEGTALMVAEDIQLEKIAVKEKVWPLLVDELIRDVAYYENLEPPSTDRWNTIPEGLKFASMTSVTWAYAINSWFAQVLTDSEMHKQAERALGLIHPHFTKYGYNQLKDSILKLLNEKVAETTEDSKDTLKQLLDVFDSYSDDHGLGLY